MQVTKYKVNEIFYSIQGEGIYSGTPMTFVRFAGCNLNCSFCDTLHSLYSEMTKEEIFHVIDRIDSKIVCFTGGEPLLQLNRDLLSYLNQQKDFEFHAETNGSIHNPILDMIKVVTISPKNWESWKIRGGQVLKIVYGTFPDSDLEKIIHSAQIAFEHYYIQPMYKKNEKEAVQFVLHNPEWRLSCQTQKYLNIK
jgi:7-carboxy-7-deazaguanine synthase